MNSKTLLSLEYWRDAFNIPQKQLLIESSKNMSKTTNNNTPSARGTPSANDQTPMSPSSPSRPLTFKTVIQDVASWWCYAILKKGDLKLFDELDEILDSLPGPLPASSSLSIRLRCLVPWHELLKQLYTPRCTLGEKQFETVQDKLLLLHQGFFSKTAAAEEFNTVLRMIQTHTVLSRLYKYLSKIEDAQNDQRNATIRVLDQCNAEWESIYLEANGVPPSLLDLVDKNNGWDFEDRRDHIVQIVSFPESALTYQGLKKKMQTLLLHWFEHEIDDSDENCPKVPELLGKRYRGIGYGGDNSVENDATKIFENGEITRADPKVDAEENSRGATYPSVLRKQSRTKRPEKNTKKQRKGNGLNNEDKNGLVYDSDNLSDWSDFDPDEELRRLKLNRERQKKLRFQKGRQMEEELVSMPVGEPSYSSPERKGFLGRSRGRLNDRDNRGHSADVPSSALSKRRKRTREQSEKTFDPKSLVTKHNNWDTDDSSGSDFGDSDDGAPWAREEDEALNNGIQCNGYGNWVAILHQEKRFLGSRNEDELRKRANILMGRN